MRSHQGTGHGPLVGTQRGVLCYTKNKTETRKAKNIYIQRECNSYTKGKMYGSVVGKTSQRTDVLGTLEYNCGRLVGTTRSDELS